MLHVMTGQFTPRMYFLSFFVVGISCHAVVRDPEVYNGPLSKHDFVHYAEIEIPKDKMINGNLTVTRLGKQNIIGIGSFPCSCLTRECGCCTGMFLQQFNSRGCMNITYLPEDFAFDFKMHMNGLTLYENRVSGKNPPPMCMDLPRFSFIQVCAKFSNVYFKGRNMHLCVDMDANFQGYEIFSRSFDCLMMGAQGVRIVKPEAGGLTDESDADVDDSDDYIPDYDENVVRSSNGTDTIKDVNGTADGIHVVRSSNGTDAIKDVNRTADGFHVVRSSNGTDTIKDVNRTADGFHVVISSNATGMIKDVNGTADGIHVVRSSNGTDTIKDVNGTADSFHVVGSFNGAGTIKDVNGTGDGVHLNNVGGMVLIKQKEIKN